MPSNKGQNERPGRRGFSLLFILTAVFVASVFLLALNKIADTDAWTHLAFGRLMFDIKAFPTEEVFTYPAQGKLPFGYPYPFWLFGLLAYGAYVLFDAAGLVLFKAASVALAFHVMLRDSLRPYGNCALSVAVLAFAVALSEYRFVLRPDVHVMIFLSLVIYCLNAYLYENRRYIYALPFIVILWANSHSSVNLMLAPFLAFIAGGLIEHGLQKRGLKFAQTPSASQIKTVSAVFAASFAASLMSPNFTDAYFVGYKILALGWYKGQIAELRPPAGWDKIFVYAADAAVVASFALNRKRFSIIHALLAMPFMALPFLAIRFKFYIAVVGGPIAARNLSGFVQGRGWGKLFQRKAIAAVASIPILIFCFLGVARNIERGAFGFGFDDSDMPKGAIQYMDRNDIDGRVFNDFQFGQYIIWKSYPKRTVFIDGRGFLPEELLMDSQSAVFSTKAMDDLYRRYGFESVLIGRPQLPPENLRAHGSVDMSFEQPGWALVYWDDVSFLYLRRDGKFRHVIEKDEYRYVKPLQPFSAFIRSINDENADALERGLRRNIKETGSSSAHMFLSLLYLTRGNYAGAIEAASGVKARGLRGVSYISMGDAFKSLGSLDESIRSYEKALEYDETPGVLYRVGVVYSLKGDNKRALEYFEKTVKLDPKMAYAYPKLIETYRALGMTEKAEDAERKYRSLTHGR